VRASFECEISARWPHDRRGTSTPPAAVRPVRLESSRAHRCRACCADAQGASAYPCPVPAPRSAPDAGPSAPGRPLLPPARRTMRAEAPGDRSSTAQVSSSRWGAMTSTEVAARGGSIRPEGTGTRQASPGRLRSAIAPAVRHSTRTLRQRQAERIPPGFGVAA
jgi:hypothetical protein